MDALGVRRPDVLTRVVEYLPEIISYVQVCKSTQAQCHDILLPVDLKSLLDRAGGFESQPSHCRSEAY